MFDDIETVNEGAGASMSGSAWMFYNHYNPDLLKAVQSVVLGSQVEDAVDSLIEIKLPKNKLTSISLLRPTLQSKKGIVPANKAAIDAYKDQWLKKKQ